MIQHVVVILYTKYELSILYSCGDIFNEKCREKEKWLNEGNNKQEKAGSQSHDASSHCQFSYKTLTLMLRNLLRKITVLIAWRERKVNKYQEEQVLYPTIQTSRCYSVYQIRTFYLIQLWISLTKNAERKKN